MHYYYKEKIRKEVIRAWQKANYLERVRALAKDNEEGAEREEEDAEPEEDADTKGIPFWFKMQIAKQMWTIESQTVKKDVEDRRNRDSLTPEEQVGNEQMRIATTVVYQEYKLLLPSLSHVAHVLLFSHIDRLGRAANNILKYLQRTTGMSATLLIGGPVPALGGQISCWS